jgi:macrolide transport system ATP-binding/permease protein
MHDFWQDIRYAARMLVKNPGFTAVAVLSLALGIGANTTIFTLVKAVFLGSVPVKDPAHVVAFFSTATNRNGTTHFLGSSFLNLEDYRKKNNVIEGPSMTMFANGNLDVNGSKTPLNITLVDWDFFDIVGVQPSLGRAFTQDEDAVPGQRPVCILSQALWARQFGADPNIVGQKIRISDQDYAVVGVMPAYFRNVSFLGSPDMFMPVMMHDSVLTGQIKQLFMARRFRMSPAMGKLKPGVTLEHAQAELQALGIQLEKEYPTDNGGRSVELIPMDQTNIPPGQRQVFLLAGTLMMSIVGLVLLIACANVANLLLTRAAQRRRELAVRLAMGASRTRLIRQLLTESLLLGLLACAFGVAIGYWLEKVVLAIWPGGAPQNLDFSMDMRVLGFTLAISLIAAMLFGLVPALQATRSNQMTSLRDRSDAPAGSTRWYSLRGVLVMVQVALSLIALVGAGLFIHSMANAQNVDTGFEVKRNLSALVSVARNNYSQAEAEQYYQHVQDAVAALPMVTSVSISDSPPFGSNFGMTIFPTEDDFTDPRNGRTTPMVAAGPGLFATRGISFIRGRDFDLHDDANSQHVIIVNDAMARQFWPGQNPLGKRIRILGQPYDLLVVGEVKTVKYATLGEPPQPIFYVPLKQQYAPNAFIYARTAGDSKAAVLSVLDTIKQIDPSMPPNQVQTITTTLDQVLTAPRMGAELLGGFGILALALAAIGLYGVMSYSVGQRTQEIGLRMALGAQPSQILAMMVGGGMTMVAVGILIGLTLAILLARTVSSLLYGIGLFDAPSFLGVSALMLLVALVACWLPSRRAMTVDPNIALRHE